LYAEAGEPSLANRRLKLSLNYYIKVYSEIENPAYECVLAPKYTKEFEKSPSCIPPFGIRIRPHAEKAGINLGDICDFPKFAENPPWTFITPEVRFDLASYRKQTTSSLVYKGLYNELCTKYPLHAKVFTDGSKSENGVAAAAVLLSGDVDTSSKRIPSDSSVYTAELTALNLALKSIQGSKRERFIIFSDSLSALEAISGRNLKHPELIDFFMTFTKLKRKGYDIVLGWVPGHVGIHGNEVADLAAKDATSDDLPISFIPFTDLKHKTHSYAQALWQEDWSKQVDNKLFDIRPSLSELLPSPGRTRKENVVFTRLKIGHTYLTHSYLLKGERAPVCESCQEPLTVKQILILCREFNETRRKYFTTETLKTLFRDVPPWMILDFLKEIGIFKQI
jgi:kelch-like protein 2/3